MQRPFDLVLFTDHFPYGNSESFLSDELSYLSEAFDRILIMPLDKSGGSQARKFPANCTIHPVPFKSFKSKGPLILKGTFNFSPVFPFFTEGFRNRAWSSPAKFRTWVTSLFLVRALASHFRNTVPSGAIGPRTLLYFYWGMRWSQVIPFIPERPENIVVRMHGSDLYEELNHSYIPFRREQIERSAGILLISRMAMRYFSEKYPGGTGKAFLSRLGTPDSGLNPSPDARKGFHIVSCANVVPVKRVNLLAESLKYLVHRDITWTHFGTGPGMAELAGIVQRDGAGYRAELRGWTSHDEVMKYYATQPVDVFVNTSSSEGVPVAVMEALSFGIPVIATDVGGTEEILDPSCGKLIPANITAEALAREIDEFLSVPDPGSFRANARRSWEKTSDCSGVYPALITYLNQLAGRIGV